jgi:hypothetical protein
MLITLIYKSIDADRNSQPLTVMLHMQQSRCFVIMLKVMEMLESIMFYGKWV